MAYSSLIAGLITKYGFTNSEEGGLDCHFQIAEHCWFQDGDYKILVNHTNPRGNIYAGVDYRTGASRVVLSDKVLCTVNGYHGLFQVLLAPLMGTEHQTQAIKWAAQFTGSKTLI